MTWDSLALVATNLFISGHENVWLDCTLELRGARFESPVDAAHLIADTLLHRCPDDEGI